MDTFQLILKHLSKYSSQKKQKMTERDRNIQNLIDAKIPFIACLSKHSIDVFPIKKGNNRFVYIISQYAKTRELVLCKNGRYIPIKIDLVRKYFGEKAVIETDEQPKKAYYSKIFADGMPNKAYKKPSKRGFYKTLTSNETQERMQTITCSERVFIG